MSVEEAIAELDKLHADKKYKDQCDLFEKKYNSPDYKVPDLMWRNARALRELANNTKDKSEHSRLLYKGLEVAKAGIDIDVNNSGCNKWYGFLLDLTGRIEGIKKRIQNSFAVKQHLDLASEKADRKDVGVLHALGVWCYEVSALSWINRKLAQTFFATPPTSTFEEALENLMTAETISPGFYAPNYLYLGKTFEKLKKKAEAREYLQKVLDYKGDDVDTTNAKVEANELLKNI